LNQGKRKCIRFCNTSRGVDGAIKIGEVTYDGEVIEQVDDIMFLSFRIDRCLGMKGMIDGLTSRIRSMIPMMCSILDKLSRSAKILIYRSLVDSRLRYLLLLIRLSSVGLRKKLQAAVNRVARVLFGYSWDEHNDVIFKNEGIRSIEMMTKLRLCKLVYDLENDRTPMEISELVKKRESSELVSDRLRGRYIMPRYGGRWTTKRLGYIVSRLGNYLHSEGTSSRIGGDRMKKDEDVDMFWGKIGFDLI
jgi:hypothetical protein